jgi:hypothetical protein
MLEPNRNQIEIFVEAMFHHAGSDGYVAVRSFLTNNKAFRLSTAPLSGGLRHLIDVAEDDARRAANNPIPAVFCPPIAVFNGAENWRAREKDLLKGLVLSVECDQHPDAARGTLEELLGPATAVVRSGGQWLDPEDGLPHDKLHLHWRLVQPAMGDALDQLKQARRLAAAIAGGDHSNIPTVHCLRWPGSWHRKASPRLCEIVSCSPDIEIDLDAALTALKTAAPPTAQTHNASADPADWGALAADIIAGRNLHLSTTKLAAKYVRSGMSKGAAVNSLRALMEQSAAKQQRPDEWQSRYDDLVRAVDSAEQKFTASDNKTPPCSLDDVVTVFDRWLALKDATALYAMLAMVTANLLDGDPVWLGLIAPPSSAKTELLNSLSRLPYVIVTEAMTPAALLSGTPKQQKAKDATGGLLFQIGKFGILAFKDFGSVIDMRAEDRSEMLSALRRIFDGEYVRQIGSEGGRTLSWRGKVGLIFAATQKYDLHHGVIGTLGDRFLLARLDASENQFDMCFRHIGKATKTMRDELATAVAGLFASLPDPLPEPPPLNKNEMNELRKTITLAIKLRAGVDRDRTSREIVGVYDPEGPARLALSLERLFGGLTIIGVSRDKAMQIINQIAMDSTPRFRLRTYEALSDDWETTRSIATSIKLPTTTTHRALEELTAQGLAEREEGDKGANKWRRPPETLI